AHVGALIALGHLRRSCGDRAGSLTAFAAASAAASHDVNLRVDVGLDLDALGRAQEAETTARGALDIDPNHHAALRLMAGLLKRRGDTDGALGLLRAAVERNPDHDAIRTELAHFLIQAGRTDEAEAIFRAALGKTPANVPCLMGFGQLMSERHRFDE